MGNAKTAHSKLLRAKSAARAAKKAISEGRIKRKTLQAPTEVIDEFLRHMAATGGKTDAEKLAAINRILDTKMT